MVAGKSQKLVIPKLIVGLGNPEPKYENTRHNIGFSALDLFAQTWNMNWQKNSRFQGMIAQKHQGQKGKLILLKPLTYMNRSGKSLRAVMDWYKLSPKSVLVIYDDMDLALGRIRLRLSGSAGGHNGIKSIIAHLGSQDFPRLRIGIGKSHPNKETIAHVLGKFAPQEHQVVSDILQLTKEAVEFSFGEGIEKTMSLYNNRSVSQLSSQAS